MDTTTRETDDTAIGCPVQKRRLDAEHTQVEFQQAAVSDDNDYYGAAVSLSSLGPLA